MRRITFVIFCLEGALLSFNVAASSALIPSIAKAFGASQFKTAAIVWLYMLPYGISAIFYGPLVRFFDAKKIELVCFFLFSLSNLSAAFSRNLPALFASRFFMGVFGASVIPLVLILIARHAPAAKRGRLIGIFFASTFAASLSGLLLSGIIPWRMIFLIPAILGIIIWILIYFYLPGFKEDSTGFKINYLPALKNKGVISLFTYIFFVSLLYHGVQQWLPVYFCVKFRFSQFLISMLITLTSLSGVFGEVLGGWLSDIKGRVKTVNLGIGLMIVSVLLLMLKLPVAILALIMIIWGLGWTLNHAGLSTMLTDLPEEFLNEAAALNSSVRFISGGIGAALGGIIMQKNFTIGFCAFGIGLLGLCVYQYKNKNRLEEVNNE